VMVEMDGLHVNGVILKPQKVCSMALPIFYSFWRQTCLICHSLTVTHPPGTHTTHVNPHGHCCEVVVMVEMDGLHVNGVILKPQKVCSMALPIFYSFWRQTCLTSLADSHTSTRHPYHPCEPSWALLWGCCDGRNGWFACQWSYIEASKGLFHGSTHILQLLKTNMPHVTRWLSHIHQTPTTHVNPHGHCCEVLVMVEMDGLHVNRVILKSQKVCSMALPIFYSFWRQTWIMSLADSHTSTRHPYHRCEPSWALLWGCCDGRTGWIACQWSYIEASKGLFHGSTHILQLLKTNMPHVTRWQSHNHQAPTTHVNPHGHCCEVVVMVEMDGLHVNGVILKPQKVCSMALPIFYSFWKQTCLTSLADSHTSSRHPPPMWTLMGIVVRLLWW
jgi:hypothetical protein